MGRFFKWNVLSSFEKNCWEFLSREKLNWRIVLIINLSVDNSCTLYNNQCRSSKWYLFESLSKEGQRERKKERFD